MGVKSNQILVGYSHKSVSCKQENIIYQGVYNELVWGLHFSLVAYRVPSCTKKFSSGGTCSISQVQWVVLVLSTATGSCCKFVESRLDSWQQPRLFTGTRGTPLPKNSFIYKLLLALEASSSYKRCPVEALSPLLLGDFIWSAFIYVSKHILGIFYCIKFPYYPTNGI